MIMFDKACKGDYLKMTVTGVATLNTNEINESPVQNLPETISNDENNLKPSSSFKDSYYLFQVKYILHFILYCYFILFIGHMFIIK